MYGILLYPVNYYGENYFDTKHHPFMSGAYEVTDNGITEYVSATSTSYLSYKFDYETGLLLQYKYFYDTTPVEESLTLRVPDVSEENEGGFFNNLPISYPTVLVSLSIITIVVKKSKRKIN